MCDFVKVALNDLKNIKVNVTFYGDFELMEKLEEKQFTVKYDEIFRTTNSVKWFDKVKEEILSSIDDFEVQRESGWAFKQAKFFSINVVKYSPLSIGSYLDVPDWVSRTGGVINIQTNENDCFELCLLAALEIPNRGNLERPSRYANLKGKKYDFRGISNPIKLNEIPIFEKRNKISVNVLFIDQENGRDVIGTGHLCKKLYNKHVNLLMITSENGSNHFCWIKDLSKLMRRFSPATKKKRFFCDRCLNFFYQKEKMVNHKIACKKVFNCAITLPREGNDSLKFTSHKKEIRVPFVIYADAEAILSKDIDADETTLNAYRRHDIYSLGYYLKCNFDDSLSRYEFNRGPDCASWFADQLKGVSQQVNEVSFLFEKKNKIFYKCFFLFR